MARSIPKDRFDALVRGATEVFIARGYRLTQMSDISAAVGVAKGTLYGYVESKEALLLLCLVYADVEGPIPLPEVLPVPAPAPGFLGEQVRARVGAAARQPVLERTFATPRAPDLEAELLEVIGEFYDLLAAHRYGIKLLDRCMDHPELGDLWQVAGREQSRQVLLEWLRLRTAAGQLPEISNPRLWSRTLIETCTTWAVHIHWDRAPESFDPDEVRAWILQFLVQGLLG